MSTDMNPYADNLANAMMRSDTPRISPEAIKVQLPKEPPKPKPKRVDAQSSTAVLMVLSVIVLTVYVGVQERKSIAMAKPITVAAAVELPAKLPHSLIRLASTDCPARGHAAARLI